MQRFVLIVGGILLGLSLAVILTLGRFASPPPAYHGTWIDPPDPRPAFVLRSGDRELRTSDFAGKPTVVVFGFTHCPDVCPTTMSRLARAMALLGEEADAVRVALITVDPDRDDAEHIQAYASSYDPRFVGLSGDRASLEAVAAGFGIHHETVHAGHGNGQGEDQGTADSHAAHAAPEAASDGYMIDHTTHVTVLDASGQARLLWPYETTPEAMAEDLRTLLMHD